MITTLTSVFVWTINDLIGCVLLGIMALFGLSYAAIVGWYKLADWVRRKFK